MSVTMVTRTFHKKGTSWPQGQYGIGTYNMTFYTDCINMIKVLNSTTHFHPGLYHTYNVVPDPIQPNYTSKNLSFTRVFKYLVS